MAHSETLNRLRLLEPELRAQGVCALYLFGSAARGEDRPGSDVDLLFDIAQDVRFSLFDQARIMRRLGEHLQAPVDLVPRRALHPAIKAGVEADQVQVFG
jgi:uncharacterized protein